MALPFLLLPAVVACSDPAGEEQGRVPATTTSTAPDAGRLSGGDIAERTRRLDSALYDVEDHRAPAVPTRLDLPALGVRGAPVEAVGLEPNGEMEIPGVSAVGWYELGVAPGEPGSAVMAAHIAFDGVDGVFRYLDRSAPGDEIVVTLDDGSTARYQVTDVQTHRKDRLPDELFSRTVPEQLVLITCGGSFNRELRSYDSNVVVVAAPLDRA